MADGSIIFTIQADARRADNAIAGLQAKVKRLEDAMKKMGQTSTQSQKKGTTAFQAMGAAAGNFLKMYVGAGGIIMAMQKAISLMKEQEQLSFRAMDETKKRAQGQKTFQKAIPDISIEDLLPKMREIEAKAVETGASVGEALKQAAEIASASSIADPVERLRVVTESAKSGLEMFAGDIEEMGAFMGIVQHVRKRIPQVSPEDVQGFMLSVKAFGSPVTLQNTTNLMQGVAQSAGLFAGDDKENILAAGQLGAAMTNVLIDRTGDLSKTAVVNFMAVLTKSKEMQRIAGGTAQELSLNQYLDALFAAEGQDKERVNKELIKMFKGKALSKEAQAQILERGDSGESFLREQLMEARGVVSFDRAMAVRGTGFAMGTPGKSTKEIEQQMTGLRQEQSSISQQQLLDMRNMVDNAILGKGGAYSVSTSSSEAFINWLKGLGYTTGKYFKGPVEQAGLRTELLEEDIRERKGQIKLLEQGGVTPSEQYQIGILQESINRFERAIATITAEVNRLLETYAEVPKKVGDAISNNAKTAANQLEVHPEN